jgi:hypothetical protein
MGKKIAVEKAIRILREVEVLQGQGGTIGDACRKLGISEHTYYRWKKEYGRLHGHKQDAAYEVMGSVAAERFGHSSHPLLKFHRAARDPKPAAPRP